MTGLEGRPELSVLGFSDQTHLREGVVESVGVLVAPRQRDVEIGGCAPPSTKLGADPAEDDEFDPMLYQDPQQRLLVGGKRLRNRTRAARAAILVIGPHKATLA